MNFSGISSTSRLGTALRYPLRWIPSDLVVPILQGRLRGKRWIVGAGVHGCWLGSYEYAKQRRFVREVRRGDVVFDIGAHAGFYTLLASELIGMEGQVIAFEPLPRNLHYLHRHIALNCCRNVVVIEAAVGDADGSVRFEEGPNSSMGCVSPRGHLEVKMVSLDELVRRGTLPAPDVIKIDIEGGELDALEGARRILKQCRPMIFLATHSQELNRQCSKLLQELGYRFEAISGQGFGLTDELFCFASGR